MGSLAALVLSSAPAMCLEGLALPECIQRRLQRHINRSKLCSHAAQWLGTNYFFNLCVNKQVMVQEAMLLSEVLYSVQIRDDGQV